MKQLFRFSLLLLALMLPASAVAYDFEVDGIYYNINGNEATVTNNGANGGYSGSVVIPATVTYNGTTFSVTSIGGEAFCHCRGLRSVTIGNSVTSIGKYAFGGCYYLRSVTIPNSVTYIGRDAFDNTEWYDNQPDGLVYAGLVAYKYKGRMPEGTHIIITDGTKSITSHAFYWCSGLTGVTIPNSVISIDEYAFGGCYYLRSVTIPDSVTTISPNTD